VCPVCNNKLVPFVVGYPTEHLIKNLEDKKIQWAGTCLYSSDMPSEWCYTCNKGFSLDKTKE
jgi:hypothetical protein